MCNNGFRQICQDNSWVRNIQVQSMINTSGRKKMQFWLIATAVAVVAFAYELYELSSEAHTLDGAFFTEIALFGVILPLLIWAGLILLDRSESQKQQIEEQQHLENELRRQINSAHDWESLRRTAIKAPLQVGGFSGISLLLYDPDQQQLETVAEWRQPDGNVPAYPTFLPVTWESAETEPENLHEIPPGQYVGEQIVPEITGYCLPLLRGGQIIALLHMYCPATVTLGKAEVNLLNSLAPSLAFAIDGMHPDGSQLVRATAVETEQRRLARYLHDTVGQDLSYLLLKIDYLRAETEMIDTATLNLELDELHTVTGRAYEHVRLTLTTLHPREAASLITTLYDQAFLVGQKQGGFQVNLTVNGEERPLSPYLKYKILGIFQETIINVKKHAQAQNVDIVFNWADDNLSIIMQDDGRGFSLEQQRKTGHYGLRIMEERAQEIDGSLDVQSQPGKGTKIVFHLPLSGR